MKSTFETIREALPPEGKQEQELSAMGKEKG